MEDFYMPKRHFLSGYIKCIFREIEFSYGEPKQIGNIETALRICQ